jgi:hypothetical protein
MEKELRERGWMVTVKLWNGHDLLTYEAVEDDPGVEGLVAHARERLKNDLDPYLTPAVRKHLAKAGITSREQLREHSLTSLLELPGIGGSVIRQLEQAGLIEISHRED